MNRSISTVTKNSRSRARLAHLLALVALLAGLVLPGARISLAQGSPPEPPPKDMSQLQAETPNWQAQYFANRNLSGAPALTRADATIDFDWGIASPDPSIPIDNFSARWSRTLNLEAGTYRFSTYTDDGVRLYIDGVRRIDKWVEQSPTEWQAEVVLAEGSHTIVMEYFEGSSDALARLSYGLIQDSVPPNSWKGEYFANPSLAGAPVIVRGDQTIDFDWGAAGPATAFPSNSFSVRWTRDIVVPSAGNYRFATTTDDGVRLSIDGQIQIDQWVARPLTLDQVDLTLSAGTHHVVVEYFEQFGDALARLAWARQASPGEGIVRINSGGSTYADSFNNFWDADAFVSNTNPTVPLTATASEEAQPIWNTTDDLLYINERATAFRYDIPLPNGDYIVRLHFAELFFNAAGVRRFNVAIQGAPVLSSFDIYGQAGKAALITRSFAAGVTNGTLTVSFSKVFDNAVVQAIDVYPASAGIDLDAPSFAAIPEPENTTYTTPPAITYAITDDVKLKEVYWRIDDQDPQPLFSDLDVAELNGQFTMPVADFNALALGAHTLSFGANDHFGNAWTQVWRFRKLKTGSSAVPIAFDRRTLLTASTPGAANFKHPTTMEFGPDGRLYVGQQDFFGKGGYIHALTLDDSRNVTNVQRIDTIFNTPNVNPDGTPAPTVKGRHLIGLDFDPRSTPQQPILWVVHSDPRFCFNQSPATCKVNPDSGIITRLVGPDFDNPANRKDYVTGLPRSRENHAPNAVHFGPDGWLYLAIGSNTNYGAISTAFSGLPEDYLTAAILRFNVNGAPASFPLDTRNVASAAGFKPGIFEMYATGFRNPYDFIWHSNGELYANVNAGNFTAGTTPGAADGCPSGYAFDPGTRNDFLVLVDKGDHGGHPNPARGQCVLDDGTMYPDHTRTPDAGFHPQKRLLYYSNGTSSDGMAEYTAPTFGGQMLGNIISATYAGNQSVRRVVLAPDGQSVEFEEDLGIFTQPLDVAVGPDGSIYVAEYGGNTIQIMEPNPVLKETGIWTTLPPLPIATQEVGTVACEGKVYVMGGLVGSALDTGAAWAYDPAGKSWKALAPYTTDPAKYVDHPAVACLNGKIYLIGGLIKAGPPVANVYEYNIAANVWTPKASLPAPRGAMAAAAIGGKVYAVGGLGAGVKPYEDRPELYIYNPAINSWSNGAPMPTARDHLVFEEIGGKLYAMGGRTAVTIQSVTAANEAYDPASNTWSARKPMPVPRAAMAAGRLHGQIQIWGGEAVPGSPYATPAGVNQQGHSFDPRTSTWITTTDELTPRHGAGGATIGNIVYVPGGATHQGNAATDVHDAFSYIATTPIGSCIAPGSNPATTDSDGDKYTNQDELDNGTDPCSSAATPSDNDVDHISDLNDPNDDNDAIPDVRDQFQFDPQNGAGTALPWVRNWNPGDPPAGKFGNSGFTGFQITSRGNGFIADKVHVGGAGGFLSLDATTGTNQGAVDTQDNALQIGFDARKTIKISTRIADPLNGLALEPGKSGGVFVGLDEDNYAKLVLTSSGPSGKPGLLFAIETGGTYVVVRSVDLALPGPNTVDLFLTLDPATKRIIAQYRVDRDDTAGVVMLGEVSATAYPGLAQFFKLGAAAGILTSNAAGTSFGLAYDYFRIEQAIAPAPIGYKVYMPLVRR